MKPDKILPCSNSQRLVSKKQEKKKLKEEQMRACTADPSTGRVPLLAEDKTGHLVNAVPSHIIGLQLLGKGSFGRVYEAWNSSKNHKIAVKIIASAFRTESHAYLSYREIVTQLTTQRHPNIVKLKEIFLRTSKQFLTFSMELMESDLHRQLRRRPPLIHEQISYIFYQILDGLSHIHAMNVVHRDLKPMNILMNSDLRVKIADFGMARFLDKESDDPEISGDLTSTVGTVCYAAPELIVKYKAYDKSVDIWSAGCILGEMCCSRILFLAVSRRDVLRTIRDHIPIPSQSTLTFRCPVATKKTSIPREPLSGMMKYPSSDANDLLMNLLVFNPSERMSARDALSHPYFNKHASDAASNSPQLEKKRQRTQYYRDLLWNNLILPRFYNTSTTVSNFSKAN